MEWLLGRGRPAVIGMVHVRALPGTPKSKLSIDSLVETACKEAQCYVDHNLDGIIVENMHDVPYVLPDHQGPEVVSVMTRICSAVKQITKPHMKCGVQILSGGNISAVAVAAASGFHFIRCEAYVYSHVADEGLMHACAGPLLRYRANINANHVAVCTDIKKKHCSHSITGDVSIGETAAAAEYFLSDAVVVTGAATAQHVHTTHLQEVCSGVESIPVLIGSGVTVDNVEIYKSAHGYIVGSHFKHQGDWKNEIDETRVARFMEAMEKLGKP